MRSVYFHTVLALGTYRCFDNLTLLKQELTQWEKNTQAQIWHCFWQREIAGCKIQLLWWFFLKKYFSKTVRVKKKLTQVDCGNRISILSSSAIAPSPSTEPLYASEEVFRHTKTHPFLVYPQILFYRNRLVFSTWANFLLMPLKTSYITVNWKYWVYLPIGTLICPLLHCAQRTFQLDALFYFVHVLWVFTVGFLTLYLELR